MAQIDGESTALLGRGTVATLAPLTPHNVLAVASWMRQADAREIFALQPYTTDIRRIARFCAEASSHGAVAFADDGAPIAALGAVPNWPGMYSVWMFATDRWPHVALATTRYARRVLIPALIDAGAHRAFCHSLAAHRVAHSWLAMLGARKTAYLPNWGRAREDFVLFTWELDDVLSRTVRARGGTGLAAAAPAAARAHA